MLPQHNYLINRTLVSSSPGLSSKYHSYKRIRFRNTCYIVIWTHRRFVTFGFCYNEFWFVPIRVVCWKYSNVSAYISFAYISLGWKRTKRFRVLRIRPRKLSCIWDFAKNSDISFRKTQLKIFQRHGVHWQNMWHTHQDLPGNIRAWTSVTG